MNEILIVGTVAKNFQIAEIETRKGRMKRATFSVYVSESKSYVPCVAWAKNAEFFEKWFATDGKPIALRGSWQTSVWEKDGVKRYDHKCNVSTFFFIPEPKESAPSTNAAGTESFMQVPDDFASELPFI